MESFKYYLDLIKKEIKLAFRNNKYLLLASVLIFVIPMITAYYYPDLFESYLTPLLEEFTKKVSDGTVTLSTESLFVNNVQVALILYAGSALFAVVGAFILFNNGLFIGFFGTKMSLIPYLALTVPHGIFEIPAIMISCTGGFVLFSFILHFIWNFLEPDYSYVDIFDPHFTGEKITIRQRLSSSLDKHQDKLKESLILLCVSVVLLVIAAFIEANLTIPIARAFLGLFGIVF